MIKHKIKFSSILIISCFFCIMSQLPNLWGNSIISLIYNIGWIVLFIAFLRKENYKIRIPRIIYLLPIIFDIIILLMQIFTSKNYIDSNMFRPLNLCFFISIIGYYLGKYYDSKIIIKIIKAFILGSIILGFSIFMNTFSGVDWQNATGYLYTAKNSAAIIFLVAIIMGVIYIKDLKKIFIVPSIVFFTFLIMMLKSRATIVCLVFVILYIIIFYVKRPIVKLFLSMVFVGLALYIIFNDSAYNFFINKIMLNNRGSEDLSVITSGRDEHIDIFVKMFPTYFFLGTGGTYLESFSLASLLSYGFFVGSTIILYAILPGIIVVKTMKKVYIDKRFKHLILALNISMLVNGLFEELTPLGPGVKCFVLWLFFGIYVGFLKKKSGG